DIVYYDAYPVSRSSTLLFFSFHAMSALVLFILALHDALPIFQCNDEPDSGFHNLPLERDLVFIFPVSTQHIASVFGEVIINGNIDRKSTRLNSSHVKTSYAVFTLKKKTNNTAHNRSAPHP